VLDLPHGCDSRVGTRQFVVAQPDEERQHLRSIAIERSKTLVSDGYGQGIATLKQAQQSNLLNNLDQRQHRAPRATGPMPPIRHVVSDDIHLIPQASNRREKQPCSFRIFPGSAQHVARVVAHIMPGLGYPTLQPRPHGRRTEEIVDECHAKDAYRDRGHAIGHCCEHLLRRIDIDDRNDSNGVAGQDGGIGPKAAEVARDEDANTHPENECREHADTLAGEETGDHDGHGGADECRGNPVDGFRQRSPACGLCEDSDGHCGG
jgi:hypothetical protein